MSETSPEARRALTEKRGVELEKWWAINFVRFMNCQDPSTLSDLPTEILVQVLEKSGSMEQLTCRKVCRSLRTAVNNLEISFDSISFKISRNNVDMKLDGFEIIYNDAANGASIVTLNEKEKMIKGENFLQLAFNDLLILLKRVTTFEFAIYGGETHAKVTYLLNVLKANQCVHVKEIEILFLPLIDICSILSYFDSQMLGSIDLNCNDTNDNFEQLAQLEQWKNAKDCTIYGFLSDNIPIEHLLHFKTITVGINQLPLQRVIEIKDKLLTKSTFKECTVWFKNTNLIEIARVFQPTYSGSETFEIEYLCNNAKFKINCDEEDTSGSRMFYIERC